MVAFLLCLRNTYFRFIVGFTNLEPNSAPGLQKDKETIQEVK